MNVGLLRVLPFFLLFTAPPFLVLACVRDTASHSPPPITRLVGLTSSKLVVAGDTTPAASPFSQPHSGQCAVKQLHLTEKTGGRMFHISFFIFGFFAQKL